MFDRELKERIATLETELARVKAELSGVKRTLSQVLGENAGLREENDRLLSFGIVPARRVKRHDWPEAIR
jgi:regulator of replication initiation timing